MPTVYTSKIYDGKDVSGRDFILTCARAFGALIEMKEAPLDAEIPEEFKPSDYHLKQVEDAKNRLKELKSLSTDEIQRKIDEEYNSSIDNNKKYYDQKIELKNRYQRVLEEVYQWQPPTPEHVKLKEYAINQLKDSIEWDCGSAYLYLKKIKKDTSTEWIKRRTESCLKDIDYHSKEYNEEVKRVNERNDWIRLLRASL